VREKVSGTELESLVELHLTDGNSLSPALNVDFILAFYVVHEITGQQVMFRELRRTISQGGTLLIVEPSFHVSGKQFRKMTEMLESSGFRIVSRPFMPLSRALVAKPV